MKKLTPPDIHANNIRHISEAIYIPTLYFAIMINVNIKIIHETIKNTK